MKNKILSVILVVVFSCCFAVPVLAAAPDPAPSVLPESSPAPTPDYSISGNELDGANGVLDDAQAALDSIYDNLPAQHAGSIQFLSASVRGLPDWFLKATVVSLILGIANIILSRR